MIKELGLTPEIIEKARQEFLGYCLNNSPSYLIKFRDEMINDECFSKIYTLGALGLKLIGENINNEVSMITGSILTFFVMKALMESIIENKRENLFSFPSILTSSVN